MLKTALTLRRAQANAIWNFLPSEIVNEIEGSFLPAYNSIFNGGILKRKLLVYKMSSISMKVMLHDNKIMPAETEISFKKAFDRDLLKMKRAKYLPHDERWNDSH